VSQSSNTGHFQRWNKKLLFLSHQRCQMKVMSHIGVKETLLVVKHTKPTLH